MKTFNARFTENQMIAFNAAIMILQNSNSDHAEQALFYLKSVDLIVDAKELKCEGCGSIEEKLFSVEGGEDMFCSDCQMECENDMDEERRLW